MAYVKVARSKNAVAALRYCEHEKSVIVSGVDSPADTETAIRLFKSDRIMWNKDNGVQAHIVIQSFDGQEISPEEANKLGQKLAKELALGYRAMVYTHSEGGNIHNHIIFSAVNQHDGKKLDDHGLLYEARKRSDELCKEMGLSIIKERKAELRYTLAEQNMIDNGKQSWKNDIREAVEAGKAKCRSLAEFQAHLKEHGITIHERGSKKEQGGKSWTYYTQHEGKEVRVRAAKLGEAYSRDSVVMDLSREKVSALEKVQEMQQAGKSVLDKANQLIGGKVQQEQERQRQLEALKATEIRQRQKAKEKEQAKPEKAIESGFDLGR